MSTNSEFEYVNNRELILELPSKFVRELIGYEYDTGVEPLSEVYRVFIKEYLKDYIGHSDFEWYDNGVLFSILNKSEGIINIKLYFNNQNEFRLFKLRSLYYQEQLKDKIDTIRLIESRM